MKWRGIKIYMFTLLVILMAGFFVFWNLSVPDLTQKNTSTVLEDANGNLLSARIASDGQWRFPQGRSVPNKFKQCLIAYEDSRFYLHHGVDFRGLLRAIRDNWNAKRIKSGGSTLTMQLVRLSTGNKQRTVVRKIWEILLAIRVEQSYTKEDILNYYSAWAPFGRNVVGLEAATWRYFGKNSNGLSWAEAAALAVLPNNPSNIFPGKGQQSFKVKRDRLLKKIYTTGAIDKITYENAVLEPLPGAPLPLPNLAKHALNHCISLGMEGKVIQSTIQTELQERIHQLALQHVAKLYANGIGNMAILVTEVKSNRVLAYVGNASYSSSNEFSPDVDLITSPRSTGSILKPLLYAMVLDEGHWLPNALVPDIPTIIGDYYPKNHDLTYDGAVPFKQSIYRSLNIPAVRMLQDYGMEKFHRNLQLLGVSTLQKPADHYGLSIILGGAEATLWDICKVYTGLSFQLRKDASSNQRFNLQLSDNLTVPSFVSNYTISNGALWEMFEAMNEVNRPDEERGWKDFNTSKIAWKTGTSFGNRDAWAIGATKDYVVGVWVGNADGEGRPELTGIAAAAPMLFDVFKILPRSKWFIPPYPDLFNIRVCKRSGYKSGENCEFQVVQQVQRTGKDSPFCPYCRSLKLDKSGQWQVNVSCESIENMQSIHWFVLPPVMEYYYKSNTPSYRKMPPFRPDCKLANLPESSFEVIYPSSGSRLFIPTEGDGKPGQVIVQVASRETDTPLFWYLDGSFLKKTVGQHQLAMRPEKGKHKLNIAHASGQSKTVYFEVVN